MPASIDRPLYRHRQDAGRRLAEAIIPLDLANPVIAAVPPGSAVAAFEVAKRLRRPLEFLVVRPICAPIDPQTEIGYVIGGPESHIYMDEDRAWRNFIPPGYIAAQRRYGMTEVERLQANYRGIYRRTDFSHRDVIVVTDGNVPPDWLRAVCWAVRKSRVSSVTLATPFAGAAFLQAVGPLIDHSVVLNRRPAEGAGPPLYEDLAEINIREISRLAREAESWI